MRCMVIVKASKDSEAGVMPGQKLLADMGKFNQELIKAGMLLGGDGLHPSSKGKRVKFSGQQRTVIDGPFTETKELVGGFFVLNCDDREQAIAIANSTDYGLSSAVCTNRLDYITRFVDELQVGTVNIWEVPGYRIEMSPFGGIKDSGLGYKEGVVEAMKSFTNVKTWSLPWPG